MWQSESERASGERASEQTESEHTDNDKQQSNTTAKTANSTKQNTPRPQHLRHLPPPEASRIHTSHSSWLAKRFWVVHASGGDAAWCVGDCSVKKGFVRGVIGRSVAPSERNKTAWCFSAPHHIENSHTPTTQTAPSKQRRKPTQNKRNNPPRKAYASAFIAHSDSPA